MPTDDTMETIDPAQLALVAGGASRSDDQVAQLLTQITSSLKDLAGNRNQSDPTQMMMLMMMMGGFGGGGGAAGGTYVAGQSAAAPVVNVDTSVAGGRRFGGGFGGGFGVCGGGGCRGGSKKGW